jgi:WD40 repeat protein
MEKSEENLDLIKICENLKEFNNHSNIVSCVRFSYCGKYLASCSWDTKINIYDAKSGNLIQILDSHENNVNKIEFSFDSKFLISVSHDFSFSVF